MSAQTELLAEVKKLPRRIEPISGQNFSYVKLDDVLAVLEQSLTVAQCTLDPLSRAAAIARELRRFHGNACHPDAMDSEINETMQRIAALSAAQCAPQPSGDLADWSPLPADLYITSVQSTDGIVFTGTFCNVPMAIGPEVHYSRVAAPPAVSSAAREEIARIIDPDAFVEGYWGRPERQGDAFKRADAILALPAVGGALRDALLICAERYMLAVKRLGETSDYNRLTYFEAPILKMPTPEMQAAAHDRWVELNDAGKALTAACAAAKLPAAGGEASKREAEIIERCASEAFFVLASVAISDDGGNQLADHVASAIRSLLVVPDERGGVQS